MVAVASAALALGFDDQSYFVPKGVVGKPYTHTFAIRQGGGSPPYHYRILQNGKMPPGLTLGQDDGKVTGTPTEAGKWKIWIEGYDSGKAAGFWDMMTQREFEFEILPALKIQPPKMTQAVAGRPFSSKLTADGGGKQAWSVASGKLPSGLSLSSDGTISGTPTTAGSFTFTAKVTDPEWDEYAVGTRGHMAGFRSDSRLIEIRVSKPKLAITTTQLPAGAVGRAYNATLAAEDGAPPVKWSITRGKLPAGLKLDAATGALTGTPSIAGSRSVTFQARDKAGAVSSRQLAINVMSKEEAALADKGRKTRMFDVRDYGAKGDGKTDDTAAIQRALDAAAPLQGTVVIPSGEYMCSTLHVPPFVGITGQANWSYGLCGGSVLRLNDAKAKCLLDVTEAAGGTITGISMHGMDLGKDIHGICCTRGEGRDGDLLRIDNCAVRGFSGDGIHFNRAWIFIVRHCEIKANTGNGMYVQGWDGWVLDNMLAGNGKAGYYGEGPNASITITANRIEWNAIGGIIINGGGHYNINGNYLDRSGGPAISLLPTADKKWPSCVFAITGNVIYRSGRNAPADDITSCHVRFERAHGVSFTGNTMCVGQDDSGQGPHSPCYGIVVRALKNCIIEGNTLHCGAMKELVHDLGEHEENVIIKDNVGSVFTGTSTIWQSPQW